MTTTAEKIKVMQTFEEGKKIESSYKWGREKKWLRVVGPGWNWADFDYRVVPDPIEAGLIIYSNSRTEFFNNFEIAKEIANKLNYTSPDKPVRVVLLREVV